ncbi:MAG: response regulator [Endomicrobiales bacterium]|nr:response regulator [Endomicrobiales bacterium]
MNQKKVLVVDDDQGIREFLETTLILEGYEVLLADNGLKGLDMAREHIPDLIILDVEMPGMDGLTLCHTLRHDKNLHFVPIIMLTGSRTHPSDKIAGLKIGADEYLLKPFLPDEISIRAKHLISRTEENISVNPLTKLPGNYTFETEIEKLLEDKKQFAACHIDLDHFKAFNDNYGYKWGDEVIKLAAKVISKSMLAFGNNEDVLVHLGGDDFLLLTTPDKVEPIYNNIIAEFSNEIMEYYNQSDKERGFTITVNRRGQQEQFPLITFSVAVASNETKNITSYVQVVDILSEMKKFAKSKQGNVLAKDKRSE